MNGILSTAAWCGLGLALLASSAPAQSNANLVPFSQAPLQDKTGNEWFPDQNGVLQRNGSEPSIINGCMLMQFGSQQFYAQQPMMTPDGREVVIPSAQPFNGVSVTRRVSLLERESGLRYLEEFTNITSRDLTVSVELRHSFNGQTQGFFSDTGRRVKDSLQAGEFGIAVLPGAQEANAPAVFFTISAPNAKTPPRVSARNPYQCSLIYTLAIPAGQSNYLIHGIGQTKLPANPKPEAISKAFRSFAMANLTKGLPKPTLQLAVNLQDQKLGFGINAWFPAERWGIAAGSSDVLVLDAASRLNGHATWTKMTWRSRLGSVDVPPEAVAAIAGRRFTRQNNCRLWLRDGQFWEGSGEMAGFHFRLINGLEMELDLEQLDRLIFAAPVDSQPPFKTPLIETWMGERIALKPAGAWKAESPWGQLDVPWAETVALSAPGQGEMAERLFMNDGTRLQVLPLPLTVAVETVSFGPQNLDFAKLRQAITPLALKFESSDDTDATESFMELVGDQRLLGRITNTHLRMLTASAPIDLTPASIRDLREVPSESAAADDDSNQTVDALRDPLFQATLWGGGTVVGSLFESSLRVEGSGFTWNVPVRLITRYSNPIPVTDSALMRRIGSLLQDLGDAQWTVREKATAELREMGVLAKGSVQEALKTSTDAEVTRRLEELLGNLE